MADSARHNLLYVAESTRGTTPTASPALLDFRHTSCNLKVAKGTNKSAELHSDGEIRDFRHGARQVNGDIGIELSYGSFDAILEAVLGGTWASDVLKIGTTRRYFSLIRHFSDLASGDKPYHFFTGCEFTGFNLTIPAEGMVTGSFNVLGINQTPVADLSALTTPTTGSPTTTKPFDAFTGSINEGGGAIATVTEVSLAFTKSQSPRFVVGSDTADLEPTVGQADLTGTLTIYFEDATLLEKFLNETESSITVTLTDLAGNDYELSIPKVKYGDAPTDVSGQGAVPIALPFQALYDSTTGSAFQITRTDA